ncbi:helix-turn-helix transcriptional regulator [Salinicoccus luteus]|uniref:helix-turn-helix transcriptional regulator n=1 Tax=Salinicoccus luteus TaxID=367840 RepID=UPI0004E18D38|nr:helix-turn-helix transcriptional regulator [Salinicoccus luteus]
MKNNVAECRKKMGYSQDRLAEKLGVSRQTIISIEKGRYNPSLPLAMILAELFKVRVEQIFFLEDKDYKQSK